MALIEDGQLNALAEDIVPAAPGGASAAQVAARDAAVAQTKALCQKILQYIVDNAEITLGTSLNDVFTAGIPVPMDGGAALQIAWKAATTGGAADASEIL